MTPAKGRTDSGSSASGAADSGRPPIDLADILLRHPTRAACRQLAAGVGHRQHAAAWTRAGPLRRRTASTCHDRPPDQAGAIRAVSPRLGESCKLEDDVLNAERRQLVARREPSLTGTHNHRVLNFSTRNPTRGPAAAHVPPGA
jgi:hypothetical protein